MKQSAKKSASQKRLHDDRLREVRAQIGEHAWADRIALAKEKEKVVLEVQHLLTQGLRSGQAAAAIAEKRGGVSAVTLQAWVKRFTASGLEGLVISTGRLREKGRANPVLTHRGVKNSRTQKALSFVKWVGSKRLVLPHLRRLMPREFRTWYEPMVGGGSAFFALSPQKAVLADLNAELMSTYEVVRDEVEDLLDALTVHENTQEHYYRVRAQQPRSLSRVAAAARFIYLNKTGFNGLYRVNKSGHFNVPYGRIGNANFQDAQTLRRLSGKLQGATLRCGDFEETCADAGEGDLVYIDPPYVPKKAGLIIRYQSEGFAERDHRRLAAWVRQLVRRGCLVLVSNSNAPLVRKLYRGFEMKVLPVRRIISANAEGRSGWDELLIRTFGGKPRRKGGSQLEFRELGP